VTEARGRARPVTARSLHGPVEDVARRLLGCTLVSDLDGARVAVRLSEVEAYAGVGEDPGSHAHRGRTARNATMFGPAGLLYVYFTYGMHWCANVVVGREGEAAAVLLRAGTVVDGVDVARGRRPSARVDRDLARGPARLTAALAIDGSMDGVDLLDAASPVRLLRGAPVAPERILVGPRTGVGGQGAATPWRFHLRDVASVSPYRPAAPRRRDRATSTT
jgi:DNA-3-methyladenine glycosylase